ncbi:MAG: hypothetical protein WKG01_06145 [Kofleriaceae bacterium]
MRPVVNIFKLGLLLLLGACATDDLTPVVTAEPPVIGDYQPEPAPRARARDLSVSCVTAIDGLDYLNINVVADLRVASAYAELVRDDDRELVDLSTLNYPVGLFTADGQFYGFSKTSGFNRGRRVTTDSSVTCADLMSFGVMVVVDFEDGDTACVFGGDQAQAGALRCPE